MLSLGTPAPGFRLPNPATERTVSIGDFADAPALVVAFLCNHCPHVRHLRDALAYFGRDCERLGVAFVGINSNDVRAFPADAPAKMVTEARSAGWTFPYLFDETQVVARGHQAACTPDFYLFDGDRRLVYRGQFDDSRPGNGRPVTGGELRRALQAVLNGQPVPARQLPSMGSNIKWKPGHEPGYFNR